ISGSMPGGIPGMVGSGHYGRGQADAVAPGNLPAALTSFLGREGDLGGVRALLSEHRLVTLTGPGGAGKTRLAIEAARAAAEMPSHSRPLAAMSPAGAPVPGGDFPGGAWLAELAPVTDPADVAATVLSALGVREQALLITRQSRGAMESGAARGAAAGDGATGDGAPGNGATGNTAAGGRGLGNGADDDDAL